MSKPKSPIEAIKKGLLGALIILLKSVKWMLILVIVGCFLVGGASAGYVASLVKDEPIRDKDTIIAKINENSESSFAYFSDGTQIGQIRSSIDQQMAENNEVPQSLKDAVIAVEDADFKEHYGIDVSGFLRAVKQKVLNEADQTGGSTITQQLVKNTFFTLKPTMDRKARELFLALRVERYLSKDEILLAYLNKSPFGNGANGYNVYGIKAAAKGIFGVHELNELNIAQSAYLAGLPQAPGQYSTFDGYGEFNPSGFRNALERQRHVLERMLTTGKITQAEYEEALNFDLRGSLAEEKQRAYSEYPFLMIEIERRASERLALKENPQLSKTDLYKEEHAELLKDSKNKLATGGYHVYTTIDKDLYDEFTAVAHNEDYFLPYDEERGHEQIGAVLLDNDSSAILAMIEGRDYYIEQLNHATQMERQPGSTMKPIAAFLPALEAGYIQPASIIDDSPILLEDGSQKHPHIPHNWDMRFHGLMTARYALDRSYNVPALRLFNEVVGIENAWDFARKLGITTLTESDARARTGVIGGLSKGTRVDELTNAYASIANKGKYNETYMIFKIVDSNDKPVFMHDPVPTPVFSEETAYLMTDMLRTVISTTWGTGASIKSTFEHYGEIPVVGKTGSTQNDRDAWFVGYSPDVTIGVWAGHDNNKPLITRSSLPQGPSTQRAKNIWSILMNTTVEIRPDLFETEAFERPENITEMTVSSVSGKLPSDLVRETGRLNTDIFNTAWVPTEEDDVLVEMEVIRHNGRNYVPQPGTPSHLVRKEILIKRQIPIYDILDQIEEILEDTPPSERATIGGRPMTLQDYYPQDLEETAPEEVDPRSYDQDEADLPTLRPPGNVQIEKLDGRNVITFSKSSNPNVAVYRFYRSYAGRDFVERPDQRVYADEEPRINDWVTDQYDYAYYVTAVDILGRESAPSARVYDIKTDNPPEQWESGSSGDGNNDDGPGNGDNSDQNNDSNSDDNNSDDNDNGNNGGDGQNPDNGNNNGGNGDSGNDDDGDTDPVTATAPGVPQQVSVRTEDNGISVVVNWAANPASDEVQNYIIYYSGSQSGSYKQIATTASTSYKYIAIPPEGWYRVAAANAAGQSQPSPAVQLTASASSSEDAGENNGSAQSSE